VLFTLPRHCSTRTKVLPEKVTPKKPVVSVYQQIRALGGRFVTKV
jgi:hypothetical protein